MLVTFFVAVLGWWVGHELLARRDLTNDRRKLRVTYLLEAISQARSRFESFQPRI